MKKREHSCIQFPLVGTLCTALLFAVHCGAETKSTPETTVFEIDFQDQEPGRWEPQNGAHPIREWGFGHVVTDPSDPNNRYLEHRPGFSAHGGTGDVNSAGLGLGDRIPRLEPGQELRLEFDYRLFVRNVPAGVNMLECMLSVARNKGGSYPQALDHWGGSFLRSRRLGFKMLQMPPFAGGESSDGYLGIALNPQQHWISQLKINLNDLGIEGLGGEHADIESDELRVIYTLSRYDKEPLLISGISISNKVTAQTWHAFFSSDKAQAMVGSDLFIGFSADSELIGDEGFELDNLRCTVGDDFQTLKAYKKYVRTQPRDPGVPPVYAASVPPAEQGRISGQGRTHLFSIPGTLKEISARKTEIESKLRMLPPVQESLQLDAYGYHGGYLPALDKLPEKPRWILDLEFQPNARAEEVVLVPAIDRRFDDSRGYGFPKRFRIVQVFRDGSSRVAREWMDEDCPDPGRMPMVIKMPDPRTGYFRLEVFRGSREGHKEVFALDEFMAVVRQEIFRAVNVYANTVNEARPYWSTRYVTDHKTSLGLPTAAVATNLLENGDTKDFSVVFDEPPEKPCVLEVDLGENRKLGWVTLFPAKSPEGILIPGYGFPGKIDMEMVPERDDGSRGETIHLETVWKDGNPGNNVVRLEGRSRTGRWIRFIIDELPRHYGMSTFALGEINVYRSGQVYPIRKVNFEGFPEGAEEQAALLYDRKAGGRPIMFLFDWLKQLQSRHRLTKELNLLAGNKVVLEERWNQFIRTLLILVVIIVVTGAFMVAFAAIVQRRRHASRLRQQITEDLHDEIGSKVGAINLFASLVRKTATEPRAIESNRKIEIIAKEMQQSLRDVLWFTNNNTDTLREVVQKLAEIAEAMVPHSILNLDRSPSYEIPETPISIQVKRNAMLIFREALHNATQHSRASLIEVRIIWKKPVLEFTVLDNGKGFEFEDLSPEGTGERRHLGLESMQRRAKQIKGVLAIESNQEKGTLLQLKLKI